MTRVIRLALQMLVLIIPMACGPTEEDRSQQAEAAKLRKARARFSSMVARHNASLEWDRHLNEKTFAFSIDVQRAIAAEPGRPLVALCALRDIYSNDGKAHVVAQYAVGGRQVFFDLEAQESAVHSISSKEEGRRFAFVVSPTGSSVPLLKAFAEPSDNEILITSADTVVVRGHLLEFLRVDFFTEKQLAP